MVQHLIENGTKITEMREEDFRLWHFVEKISVYRLTSSDVYIFYKGWGLNKYKFIPEKALESLKYYYETRKLFTPDEYEQFKFMIDSNVNPFANETLMEPILNRCVKSGYELCNEFIPLVISERSSSKFNYTYDELRLLDQMSIDNIHNKIYNYFINEVDEIEKEEMIEVPKSEVTELVKKRMRKRLTTETRKKKLRKQ